MNISFSELNILVEKFSKYATDNGFENFKLNEDYYWQLPDEMKHDFGAEKPELMVGSLVDDVESLKKIIHEGYPFTGLDFERLGHLFIYLAQHMKR